MNLSHRKRESQFSLGGNKGVVSFARVKKQNIAQKFNAMLCTSPFLLFFHYSGSKKDSWQKARENICQQGVKCESLFLPNGALCAAVAFFLPSSFPKKCNGNLKEIKPFFPPNKGKDIPLVRKKTTHFLFSYAEELPSGGNRVLERPAKSNPNAALLNSIAQRCRGSTLVIACTSVQHACVVAEICLNANNTAPTTVPFLSMARGNIPEQSNKSPAFLCIGGLYNNNLISALDVKRCISLFQHKGGEFQINNNLVLSLRPGSENLLSLLRALNQICLLPNSFLQAQLSFLHLLTIQSTDNSYTRNMK